MYQQDRLLLLKGRIMNQEKIWEAFQNDESLVDTAFSARRRFEFIAKKIPQGCRVLNIGVGNGHLESILVDKGGIVSCLDPSDSAIDKLRERLGLGDRAKSGYSQLIPFSNNSFDYVIMSEVLEHLSDETINATLKEVKRVLKKEGKFIGTVPADENIEENIVICPHCAERFHRWGHVQSFSEEKLLKLLESEFYPVTVKRTLFSDYKQLNWKGKVLAILQVFQVYMNLKGRTQNFYFEVIN